MTEPALNREALLDLTDNQELMFLRFFDELPMGIMIIDVHGTALYYNQAQLAIDEVKAETVLNRPMVETYGPASRGTSIMLYCLSTRRPVLNRWQIYHSPAGKKIRAMSHAVPLFKEGRLTGCIALTRHYPDYEPYVQEALAGTELPSDAPENLKFKHLAGRNKAFRRALEVARAAASVPMPVLIHGETGVGKELFARGIHNASPRAAKPFVPVNCAAIPESLFESLMFGVTRGAFTGAVEKTGFFEEADGGVIFLDELDSMPLVLQSKLLRVIQEKSARRLGSRKDRPVDVKIISAMGRNPLEAVEAGQLRNDLYFRLGAVQVSIPPLRDRLDDLELLINHFVAKHSDSLNKKIQRPSPGLLELLRGYNWPGNIRELEHIITGAMIMAGPHRQTLGPDLLPEYFKNIVFDSRRGRSDYNEAASARSVAGNGKAGPANGMPPVIPAPPSLETPGGLRVDLLRLNQEHEKELISQRLAQSFGNVSLAARLLNISPQSLAYKMKKHGLKRDPFKL